MVWIPRCQWGDPGGMLDTVWNMLKKTEQSPGRRVYTTWDVFQSVQQGADQLDW